MEFPFCISKRYDVNTFKTFLEDQRIQNLYYKSSIDEIDNPNSVYNKFTIFAMKNRRIDSSKKKLFL